MRRFYLLSAIGRDRPGLVAELAQLIYDCGANLEDSRMTILGTDFAVILLCSSSDADVTDRIGVGAKRLERDHGLTILQHSLEGEERPVGDEASGRERLELEARARGDRDPHELHLGGEEAQPRAQPGKSPSYAGAS